MAKISLKGKTLADFPEVLAQWHPSKNPSIEPRDIAAGSGKKVWWKCPVADDHEWKQSPLVRNYRNTGCPCCQNLKLSVTNSFVINYPEIAAQWHPTKNGDLRPDKIISGAAKKVWWKCAVADDHVWRTSLDKRISGGQGCPCCAIPIRKVVPSNSLATTHPEIAGEWDYDRNKKEPTEVAGGSASKAYWICPEGHSFSQMISNRTLHHQRCPYCTGQKVLPDGSNSLAAAHPWLIEEWDDELNHPVTPWEVRPATHKRYHWKCLNPECGSRWVAQPASRTHFETGCPACAEYGFNPEIPAFLYCLALVGPTRIWWYKIGITDDLERRARQIQVSLRRYGLPLEVDILDSIRFDKGGDAQVIETRLKDEQSIRASTTEKFDGNSELFSVNPIEWARNNEII